jgi:hypothetical protein
MTVTSASALALATSVYANVSGGNVVRSSLPNTVTLSSRERAPGACFSA